MRCFKLLSLLLGLLLGAPNFCAAQTTTVFDVLVATETLTVVGTTTLQGNAFSVGNSSFVVNQGKVGIATAAPAGLFTVGNGTITVLNSGFVGIGTSTPSAQIHAAGPAISGGGAQFKWIASSASIRAGEVSGRAWDNIGLYSTAFGLDNETKGYYSSVTGGQLNTTASSFSVIGGGYNNSISSGINSTGLYTVISGGAVNDSRYFAKTGFIGGGVNNSIQKEGAAIASGSNNVSSGFYSFIGGGASNTADGVDSTVAGGNFNALSSCDYCAIGGGGGNNATGAAGAVIAGGGISSALTTIGNVAGGISASVLGGAQNTATGDFSATLGGFNNRATAAYAIGSGLKANATTKGSFVWADSQNTDVTSSIADEFRTRAGGGYVLLSTPTAATTIVSSGAILISTSATAASAVPNIFISSVNGNIGIGTLGPTTTLDVNGSSQFGLGANKSTFTVSGGLQLKYGISATTASISSSVSAASATLSTTGSDIFALTSSTGIHILNGKIKLEPGASVEWPDGTVSVSSGSSGGGASFANEWQWVGDTVAANNASVGFSNLVSSAAYRIEIDIVGGGGTGRLFVQFNGDTTNNYRYGYQGEVDNNSNGSAGGSSQPDITLCLDSGPPSGGYHGSFDFATVYGSPKVVIANARWTYLWSSNYITGYSGGSYSGSATLSSVKVGIGSGRTFSGVVKLFKRNGATW